MAATRIAEKCFSNLFMDPDAVDEAERKDKMEKKRENGVKAPETQCRGKNNICCVPSTLDCIH